VDPRWLYSDPRWLCSGCAVAMHESLMAVHESSLAVQWLYSDPRWLVHGYWAGTGQNPLITGLIHGLLHQGCSGAVQCSSLAVHDVHVSRVHSAHTRTPKECVYTLSQPLI